MAKPLRRIGVIRSVTFFFDFKSLRNIRVEGVYKSSSSDLIFCNIYFQRDILYIYCKYIDRYIASSTNCRLFFAGLFYMCAGGGTLPALLLSITIGFFEMIVYNNQVFIIWRAVVLSLSLYCINTFFGNLVFFPSAFSHFL